MPRAGAALPPRVRPGHGCRHDRLVTGDPARPGVRVDGRRARGGRVRGRQAAVRRSWRAVPRRATPTHRCGCSGPTTTSGSRTCDRGRIVPDEVRGRWMGTNGGVGSTVFVDGFMAGLWWWRDGRRPRVLRPCSDRLISRVGRAVASSTTRSTSVDHATRRSLSDASTVGAIASGCGRAEQRWRPPRRSSVRSTEVPSRTGSAPTAANAASSSSLIPPSGPTTMTISPRPGTGRSASGPEAASCSTTGTDGVASRPTTSSVVDHSATSGNHGRRACLAASRAVAAPLRQRLVARGRPATPRREREAAHGTIRSTPTSVSISTASSPRSPLGMAWTTTTRGISGSAVRRPRRPWPPARRCRRRGTVATDRRARPVGQHQPLADPQPLHDDGVPGLVAVEQHRGTDRERRPPRGGRRTGRLIADRRRRAAG